jgi:hypothetical protein
MNAKLLGFFSGFPTHHFPVEIRKSTENQELLQTLSQIFMEHNLPVFAMEDESAIFVKQNKATYVGKILWINNGNICQISQKIGTSDSAPTSLYGVLY